MKSLKTFLKMKNSRREIKFKITIHDLAFNILINVKSSWKAQKVNYDFKTLAVTHAPLIGQTYAVIRC